MPETEAHAAEASRLAVFRRFRWLLVVLLVISFLLISWLMYRLAVGAGGIEISVAPVVMDRGNAPSWLPDEALRELERLANEAAAGRGFFEPDLPGDVAAAIRNSPWTAEVLHVRRHFPSRLDCKIAVRKPFAGVNVGKIMVVDKAGVRLPLEFPSAEDTHLPVINGARSYPPEPGKVWEDAAVAAGTHLLKSLLPLVKGDTLLQPVEVTITNEDGLPFAGFTTSGGASIRWGIVYRPGEEPVGLSSARERIEAVRNLLDRVDPGSIEAIDAAALPAAYKPSPPNE